MAVPSDQTRAGMRKPDKYRHQTCLSTHISENHLSAIDLLSGTNPRAKAAEEARNESLVIGIPLTFQSACVNNVNMRQLSS